jgi:hypothetical protein
MNPHRSTVLAKWRMAERAFEVGLHPDVVKRLDDLRVQDAQLMQRPSFRTADPAARDDQATLTRVSAGPIPGSSPGFGGGAWWRR